MLHEYKLLPPREFATRETDKTRFWLHSPSSIFSSPKLDDLCSLLPPQFLQPNITTGVSDTQIVNECCLGERSNKADLFIPESKTRCTAFDYLTRGSFCRTYENGTGTGFECRQENQLPWLRLLVLFFSPSTPI